MTERFIVFARKSSKNFILPIRRAQNQNVEQIIIILQRKNAMSFNIDDEILMVKTPFFRETLEPECNPIEKYPKLVIQSNLKSYQRPEYYLMVGPKKEKDFQFFYPNSVVQNDIHLPWEVKINPLEFQDKSSSDLCDYLIASYPYKTDNTQPKTILNEKGQVPSNEMKATDMLTEFRGKKYTICCSLTEDEFKKVNMRCHVIEEIRKTEIQYITQLLTINQIIIPQFKANRVFADADYKKFDIIENIARVHNIFLSDLNTEVSSYATMISTTFLSCSEFFKMVKEYIKNLNSIYEIMNHADKGKIEQIVTSDPRLNNMDPMSYFIVPLQRVPKYPLFLRDLISFTPKCHPDAAFLDMAFKSITSVLDSIEYSKESAEAQEKLYNIYKRLSKKVDILYPSRRLLATFDVKIKLKGIRGIFYTFNDMVMLTTQLASKNKEDVIHDSKIEDFKYLDQKLQMDTISFHIDQDGSSTNCIVEFMNSEDKEKFIQLIEERRLELYKEANQAAMFFIQRVQLQRLSLHVFGHDSVALNSSVFTFGGKGFNHEWLNVNSFFSPFSKSFNVYISPSGPSSRAGHALAVDEESRIFLFGGECNNDFFNDLYVGRDNGHYGIEWEKVDVDTSELVEQLPEPRAGHTMVHYNGELIVFGGYQRSTVYNDVWVFSIKDSKWSKLECFGQPAPRYYHSACKCGQWMVVHGGRHRKTFNDTSFFDMEGKKWLKFKISGKTPCRYGHKSLYMNGFFIFFGGSDDKKKIVSPSAINARKDKDWAYEDFEMGGNEPSTLFMFGLVHFEGPQFYVYGGIDPLSMTKDSSSPSNDTVSNSFYCVRLPKAMSEELDGGEKIPVPDVIEGGDDLRRRRNTLNLFDMFKLRKNTPEPRNSNTFFSFIYKKSALSNEEFPNDATPSTGSSDVDENQSKENKNGGEQAKESIIAGENQAGEAQAAECQPNENQTNESQGNKNQTSEVQTIEAQGAENQTDEVQTTENQTDETQTTENQTDEAQTTENQTDEAQTTENQTDETQTTENQTDEVQTTENQTDEAQTTENQTDEAQTTENQTDEAQTTENQTDETQTIEAQAAENQNNEDKTDENQANEIQTNEDQAAENQTDEAQTIEAQAAENQNNEVQTNESQGAENQTDEAQTIEAQAAENQNNEDKTDENQANEIQTNEDQAAENQTDEAQGSENQNNEDKTDEDQTNEIQTSETQPTESKANIAQTGESQSSENPDNGEQANENEGHTDENQTNGVQPIESKESEAQTSELQESEAHATENHPSLNKTNEAQANEDRASEAASGAASDHCSQHSECDATSQIGLQASGGGWPDIRIEAQRDAPAISAPEFERLAGEVGVDPSNLLPFQRKQLEQKLTAYNSVVTDNESLLGEISAMIGSAQEEADSPPADVFVKVFDQAHRKMLITKIQSTTTFDEFQSVLADLVKYNPNEKSSRFMNIYPITPCFYYFYIRQIVQNKMSHLTVYVK